MTNYRSLGFFASIFFALAWLCAAAPTSAQAPLITSPVDNDVRVRIPNSTHPNAQPSYDAGPLDGATSLDRMILVLGASSDQEHQARTLLDSQQTKGSPDFHQWITPDEFGQKFGPSEQDVQQVTVWLQQQGFAVTSVAKSRRWIEFSGSSAQVESAFQTQMRHYLVDGELHTANASDITIPAALSPVVRGVTSLHDFYSKPSLMRSTRKATAALIGGKPLIDLGDGGFALTPPNVATIYNLNPLYSGVPPSPKTVPINGSGQTIAIVAESLINTIASTGVDDVANFRQLFGLPANSPNIVLTGPAPASLAAEVEATLDVEWSGAVAPEATIDLVESAGTLTTDPIILSSMFVVDTNLAPVMSMSFHECELVLGSAENAFWNALWEQAAAQGISVFVSAGDNGAADCEGTFFQPPSALAVNGLGSTPFNTSVGGTEFDETVNGGMLSTFWGTGANSNPAIGYIPEMVWNDCVTMCDAATGGGISILYPVPSWQTLPILGLSGARYPNRVLPDVSLSAAESHDPYVFCFSPLPASPDCQVSGGVVSFNSFGGGTSFSSPEMAGVMALINQATGVRQGLANFEFYSLAASESANYPACNSSDQTNPAAPPGAQCIFNDVTVGNNGVPGGDGITFVPPGDIAAQLGYNAVPGYDPSTGLGTINAARLVNAWAAATAAFKGSSTTLSASFNGTSLPSNSVNIVHGQPVSITVSVATLSANKSQTPSNEISLLAQGGSLSSGDAIELAPISGSGGTAATGNLSVKSLPGGTNYNLSAYFPGDGVFAGSTSNTIALSIAPENTTTALQSGILGGGLGGTITPGSTLDYGDPMSLLEFSANVAGASQLLPTVGSVTFTDNGNPLGSVPLGPVSAGLAQYVDCITSPTCLTLGQHVITATYAGDAAPPASYTGSASSTVTVTVTKGNPILVSVRAPLTAVAGQQVNLNTFLIFTSGALTPTGTIQFLDGTTPLGAPVPVGESTNTATVVTFNADGTHNLFAQYSGDNLYNAASSPVDAITITPPFTLSGAPSSQTIQQGQTATYNLTLTPTSFTGTVSLTCASTNAPAGTQCNLPSSETFTSSTAAVPFTVMVTTAAAAAAAQSHTSSSVRAALPFTFAVFVAGLFFVGSGRTRKIRLLAAFAVLTAFGMGMTACGGGNGNNTPPPPLNATFTVTATSGSQTTNTLLSLTINP